MNKPFATELIILPPAFGMSDCDGDCDCNCDCDCDCLGRAPTWSKSSSPPYALNPPTTLTSAYLELTPACNSRCVGCSNVFINNKLTRQMEQSTAPLNVSVWREIIHKLSPHIKRLSITGGEPTLYRHFDNFINLLDEYDISYTLFTNARWLEPRKTIQTLKRAKGLRGLLVSLHGKDAATHEAFTMTPGSFDETLKNIHLATQSGISVTQNCIINRYTYAQSRQIYQLGKSLGVHKVVFNRYIGAVDDDCAPLPEQLKHALIEIEAMRVAGKAVKLSATVPQCFHPSAATGCGAGESFVTVDPWGSVKPCNHAPLILGNLRYDSLQTIMSGSQLDYWRNLLPSSCQSCSVYNICKGGCRAEAMLNRNQGDSLIQTPLSPKEDADLLLFPDYLRPLLTQPVDADAIAQDCGVPFEEWVNTLDGSITLKDLGSAYGQRSLDTVGKMYKFGYVQFV